MPIFNAAEGLPAEIEDHMSGLEENLSEAEMRSRLEAKESELNDLLGRGQLSEHGSADSIEKGEKLVEQIDKLKKRLAESAKPK